jgi:hypothetical protein
MRRGSKGIAGAVSALALVLTVGFAWRGLAVPSWLVPLRDEYRVKLEALKVDDGIDASEAQAIADLYMLEYVSGCGAPMVPQLRDGTWISRLRLGVAGKLSDRVVRVDPRTGAVSSPGGPTFATFRAFADDLIGGIAARRR